MKGKLRKTIIVCAIMLFTICAVCGEQGRVYAATATTPGKTYANATKVELNTAYSSKSSDTIQFYKFEMANDGVVEFDFRLTEIPKQASSPINSDILSSISNASYGYYAFFNVNDVVSTSDLASMVSNAGSAVGDGGSYFGPVLDTNARNTKMIGLNKGTYYFAIAKVACSTCSYEFTVKTCSVTTAFETERNASFDAADNLNFNNEMTGTNSSPTDDDMYKFSLNANAMVKITFSHDYSSSLTNLYMLTLYDDKKTPIATFASKGTESQVDRYIGLEGAAKGKTYYLKVSGGYLDTGYYKMLLTADTSNACETEVNNSFSTADKINLATTVYGSNTSVSTATSNLTDNSIINIVTDSNIADSDYYTFDVPAQGLLTVSLNHVAKGLSSKYVSDVLYTISVYDDKQNLLYSVDSKYGDVNTKTAQIGVLAGKYYVCISGKVTDTDLYHFSVDFNATNYCETEPNDNFATADPVELNQKYIGAIAGNSDYFVFTTPSTGVVSLNFTHDAIAKSLLTTAEVPYTISLYRYSEGQAFYTFYSKANETTKTSPQIGLPAGTYYAVVSGTGVDKGNYGLKVKFTAKKRWETETNDTLSKADIIDVNATYGGSIHTTTDVDYFQFTTKNKGVVSLNFSHDSIAGDLLTKTQIPYTIKLYRANESEPFYTMYSKAADTNKTSPKMGLPAGKYYVVVTGLGVDKGNYRLKVKYKENLYWECENNDTANKANSINLNKTYGGSLDTNSDVDYFTFTTENKGVISISFTHDAMDKNLLSKIDYPYIVKLYRPSQSDPFYTFYSGATETSKISPKIGLPAGKYYAVVSGNGIETGNYTIKLNYTKKKYWETEDNDTVGTADKIKVNKTYGASLQTSSDSDYYVFNTEKKGIMSLEFSHQKIDDNLLNKAEKPYTIQIYKNSTKGEPIYSFTSGATQTSNVTPEMGVPKGKYYIVVSGSGADSGVYRIKVNYAAKTYWESECNDTPSQANPIKVNQTYGGSLQTAKDVDYFTFTTKSKTQISFTFNHQLLDDNLINKADKPYTIRVYRNTTKGDPFFTFNSEATNTSKTTAQMGLPKGKYYVVVSGSGLDKGNYKLTVNQHKNKNWECEDNNSASKANVIKTDVAYGGALQSASDVDFYKFSVNKTGYMKLNFKQEVVNGYATSTCYKVYIYKASDLTNEMYCLKVKGDDTSIYTPEIGLKKGNYYVKVTSMVYTNHDYEIKVITKASKYREIEPNDSMNSANTIKTGKTYTGSIRAQEDLDFYKFTMKANGYARINLKQSATTESGIYRMYLYDKDENELYYTVVRGGDNNLTTARIGLKKGTYYILLKPYGRLTYTGNYSLKVTTKKAANYETENNNTFGTADVIRVGGTISGSTLKQSTGVYDRKDYYKITVKKTTKIKVTMTHKKYSGSDIMWDVAIYDKDENRVTHNNDYIYSKKSTASASTGTITLKKGTYYIEVNAHKAAANKEYTLKVKEMK